MRQQVLSRLAYPFFSNQVSYESLVPLARLRLAFFLSGRDHTLRSLRISNPF